MSEVEEMKKIGDGQCKLWICNYNENLCSDAYLRYEKSAVNKKA